LLPERGPREPYDERLEWERDGQYYHYLTKWMHALNLVSRATGDPDYRIQAIELARAAHAAFTYLPVHGRDKRMYWKMSIDLSRPLVLSMGQHDPLDGYVTFQELRTAAAGSSEMPGRQILAEEISDLSRICRGMSWVTGDPLGTGGLLVDALRILRLMRAENSFGISGMLDPVLRAARHGLVAFSTNGTLGYPAGYRLAFRELGLSIGLAGIETMQELAGEIPDRSGGTDPVKNLVEMLVTFVPVREQIERFWMDPVSQGACTWTDHREINSVMLATSLAPDTFLKI
jgi:hypothetical protein